MPVLCPKPRAYSLLIGNIAGVWMAARFLPPVIVQGGFCARLRAGCWASVLIQGQPSLTRLPAEKHAFMSGRFQEQAGGRIALERSKTRRNCRPIERQSVGSRQVGMLFVFRGMKSSGA